MRLPKLFLVKSVYSLVNQTIPRDNDDPGKVLGNGNDYLANFFLISCRVFRLVPSTIFLMQEAE